MTQPTTFVRTATLDDVQAIAHVHVEAWRSAYRGIMPAHFLDGLSKAARRDSWVAILRKQTNSEFNIVAEQDGKVVGFASCGPERKNDPHFTGELYALYLLNEFRGQGRGTILLRSSVARLLTFGHESMKVWVLKDNPYRSFYERHGGILLSKQNTIEIGDTQLVQVAYGWPHLEIGHP